MNLLNQHTNKEHIVQFEKYIAELLEPEFPQLKTAMKLSKVYEISFESKPHGIYINRGFHPEDFEIVRKYHKSSFVYSGISVFNVKENQFQPVILYYITDGLTFIEVENPKDFHNTFDLKRIQKNLFTKN